MSASYNELANYLHNLSGLLVHHAQQPINNATIQQANEYSEALTAVYPLLLEKLRTYNTQRPIAIIPTFNAPRQTAQIQIPTVTRPMTPTVPTQPLIPMSPTVPVPMIPTVPTPMTPTIPTPLIPTVPTPLIPTIPTPMTPTIPTPMTPTIPTPMTPTVPTPMTPTAPTQPLIPRPMTPTVPTQPLIPGTMTLTVPTNRQRKQVPVVNVGDVGTNYKKGWADPFRVINVSKNGRQLDLLFDLGRQITIVWRDNKSYPAGWYNIDTKPWQVVDDRKWGRFNHFEFGVRERYDTTD